MNRPFHSPFAALALCAAACLAQAPQVPSVEPDSMPDTLLSPEAWPKTISGIYFIGNKRTRERILRLVLSFNAGIREGVVYDSAAVAGAVSILKNCGAFLDAKILRTLHPDGVHLHVVLAEMPRLMLSDIGGNAHLADSLYGEPESFLRLWRIDLGFRMYNLRGSLESLTLYLTFFEWRHIRLAWVKPFVGTPYSLGLGLGIYDYPYTNRPYRMLTVKASATGSRSLPGRSSIYLTVAPMMNRLSYEGRGGADAIANVFLYEMQGAIGTSTRRCDDEFPHRSGWRGGCRMSLNLPSAESPDARVFVQFDSDLHLYHAAWPGRSTMAYRLQTTLRGNDGGSAHWLEAGGESTIRGYGSGMLGVASAANNQVLAAAEYRFTMFSTPSIRLPGITRAVLPTRDVHYRFDGGLFVDYARMWHDLPHPNTLYEDAYAIGGGLRILLPPARRTVIFDVAPLRIYAGRAYWGFNWNFYVDLQI